MWGPPYRISNPNPVYKYSDITKTVINLQFVEGSDIDGLEEDGGQMRAGVEKNWAEGKIYLDIVLELADLVGEIVNTDLVIFYDTGDLELPDTVTNGHCF